VTGTLCVAPVERDRVLELVTRSRATDVGAHLWRGEQLDDRRTVAGFGLTEHEPLRPDRGRWPRDGFELSSGMAANLPMDLSPTAHQARRLRLAQMSAHAAIGPLYQDRRCVLRR